MNEEHRDAEEVLVAIKKAAIFVDPFVKIASKGLIFSQNGKRKDY